MQDFRHPAKLQRKRSYMQRPRLPSGYFEQQPAVPRTAGVVITEGQPPDNKCGRLCHCHCKSMPELCSRAPSAQATPIPRTSCCIYWPMHCTRRYTSLLRPTHSGNCTGRAPTLTECEVQGNCHYTGTRQCAKTIPTHTWREKVHPKWTTGWLNISCSAKHALQPS